MLTFACGVSRECGTIMRLHALVLVKNEADVIEEMLRAAAAWCDRIHVLDNGSDDGTDEIVRRLADELPAVHYLGQDLRPYSNDVRDVILRRCAKEARAGDWWCIVDADEFLVDDPRPFLAAVHRRYRQVFMLRYDYLFTTEDHEAYRRDPAAFHARPVRERLRHFQVSDFTDARFFRHERDIRSTPERGRYRAYPARLRMRHYAYRSPEQIAVRLETRRAHMLRGEFLHEKRATWAEGAVLPGPAREEDLPRSWEERVAAVGDCLLDRGDGVMPDGPAWAPPQPRLGYRVKGGFRLWLRRLRRAMRSLVSRAA
jgi:glycosyltransferase involved in cell wall biosynthesis